jgi:sarcosine oxidase
VGDEGLVITGDETVTAWSEAMADAGASHRFLNIEEAAALVPIARPVGSVALFDPAGGPTRARRAIDCLLAVCAGSLYDEDVVAVDQKPSCCIVSTPAGIWECDEVILTAGVETGRLAQAVGIGKETEIVHDSRFTYTIAEQYRDHSLACWFDQSGAYGPGFSSYGQRVGSTGFYAVGVGWGVVEGLTADEESAQHREKALGYMREAYPGLDPVPVDEIRCTSMAHGVREDGDGFLARRSGGVTALYGKNLFKFAPLLGQLLAQTALTGELAEELAAHRAAVS